MFAYCMNNPVNMSDPSGHFPLLAILIGAAVVTGYIATLNHIENAINKRALEKNLKETYSKEEAKAVIDDKLSTVCDCATVTFNDNAVRIEHSSEINSKRVRQEVALIISRTEGVTGREYDDLAAEWNAHNWATKYYEFTGDKVKLERAQHVDLDLVADDDKAVLFATDVFELIGWD